MRTTAKAAFGFFALLTLGAAVPASAQYAGPGYGPPDSTYDNSYGDNSYDDNSSAPYDSGYYGDPNYGPPGYGDTYGDSDAACDFYTPPWGYPPDYCDYQLWNEPVYFGGAWLSGPIYYRDVSGVPYYWIRGGWHRDEWRGPRPRSIQWGGRNIRWSGEIHHRDVNRGGEHRFDGRNGSGNRTQGRGQLFNRQSYGGHSQANVQPNNGGFAGRQRFSGQSFGAPVTGNPGGNGGANSGGRHRGGFVAQTQSAPAQNNGGFFHPKGEGGRHRGEAHVQAAAPNNANANSGGGRGDGQHHHRD